MQGYYYERSHTSLELAKFDLVFLEKIRKKIHEPIRTKQKINMNEICTIKFVWYTVLM